MSRHEFFDRTDAGLVSWTTPFGAQLTANPTSVGLVAADATLLSSRLLVYSGLLAEYHDPLTRTHAKCVAKNMAKADLIACIRGLVRRIQAFPGITNELRAQLGIALRDVEPSPRPAPSTRPVVTPLYARGMIQTLRLRDETSPDTRAKPECCAAAELYVFAGEDAPALGSPGWVSLGIFTRSTVEITFAEADAGKLATIAARWFSEKGAYGPYSDRVPLRIPGAVKLAA